MSQIPAKIKQAQAFLKEKKFSETSKIIQDIFRLDKNNPIAFDLLEKTRKEFAKYQSETVKKTIKDSQKLWDEKQYETLYKIFKELDQFSPHNPKVEEQLARLSRLKEKNISQKLKNIFQSACEKYQKKNYEETIKICQEILQIDASDYQAYRLLQKAKRKYVDQKLPLAEELIGKEDWITLKKFYLKLYYVAPEYEKIKKLLADCQKKIEKKQEEEKKEFIKKKLTELQNKTKEGKIEDIIMEADALLKNSPHNREIQKILQRAEKKQEAIIDKDLLKQMIESQTKLTAEYQADKTKFIKI